jgi:hypothetical protein
LRGFEPAVFGVCEGALGFGATPCHVRSACRVFRKNMAVSENGVDVGDYF